MKELLCGGCGLRFAADEVRRVDDFASERFGLRFHGDECGPVWTLDEVNHRSDGAFRRRCAVPDPEIPF